MNAADLRTLALSRATQNHPVHLVLDDQLRTELNEARQAVDALTEHRGRMTRDGDLPPTVPESITEEAAPTPDIDRMIQAASEVADQVEAEAIERGVVLTLNFIRLAPAEYQVNLQKAERFARDTAKNDPNTNENSVFVRTLGEQLIEKCFTGASTPDGERVELSLDEILTQVCTDADREDLRNHCIAINRQRQSAPLVRASSGRPVKS